jgi:hypothetical protein
MRLHFLPEGLADKILSLYRVNFIVIARIPKEKCTYLLVLLSQVLNTFFGVTLTPALCLTLRSEMLHHKFSFDSIKA